MDDGHAQHATPTRGVRPHPNPLPEGEGTSGLTTRERGLRRLLADIELFSRHVLGTPLRPYQLEPARAILDSVLNRHGRTFTIMMSRQAGKNELSAQLEAYLLNLFQRRGGAIVKAAPTFHPQIVNSMLRLERVLENDLNRGRWSRQLGSLVQLGRARVFFYSGEPESHVVGATASILPSRSTRPRTSTRRSTSKTSARWALPRTSRPSSTAPPGPRIPCWSAPAARTSASRQSTASGAISATPGTSSPSTTRITARTSRPRWRAWAPSTRSSARSTCSSPWRAPAASSRRRSWRSYAASMRAA